MGEQPAGEGPAWWGEAFARLAEGTPARLAVVHARGDDAVFEWANRSAATGLGYEDGTLVGRSIREIYPTAAAEDVLAHLAAAREHGRETYETVRDLPGGRQSVRVDVLPLDDDRFVLSSLDISVAREAQRRLDAVTRTARIGIYHWNVVDDEVWWSDELFRILGYDPGEVAPTIQRFLDRVHADDLDTVAARIDDARREGTSPTSQHRVVAPDGTLRVVESRAQVVTGDGGALLYLLGTLQDITERVALERQAELLRRATARQHTALEVHDRIVQGLSTVWLALELGDLETARAATSRATANAQQVVADLLGDVGEAKGGLRPGDLVNRAEASDR